MGGSRAFAVQKVVAFLEIYQRRGSADQAPLPRANIAHVDIHLVVVIGYNAIRVQPGRVCHNVSCGKLNQSSDKESVVFTKRVLP